MIQNWSSDMKAFAEQRGQVRVEDVVEHLQTALSETLPNHVDVRADGDDVTVRGPALGEERLVNDGLRDVGFLAGMIR